jgi:hypothetical protein
MSARIALEPIAVAPIAVGEYHPRPNTAVRPPAVDNIAPQQLDRKPINDQVAAQRTSTGGTETTVPVAPVADPVPQEPVLPPGAMFAAAVVAGALPPYPESPEELLLRVGGQAWSPPDSELRLRDRSV